MIATAGIVERAEQAFLGVWFRLREGRVDETWPFRTCQCAGYLVSSKTICTLALSRAICCGVLAGSV